MVNYQPQPGSTGAEDKNNDSQQRIANTDSVKEDANQQIGQATAYIGGLKDMGSVDEVDDNTAAGAGGVSDDHASGRAER